jgi:hypothetical protein
MSFQPVTTTDYSGGLPSHSTTAGDAFYPSSTQTGTNAVSSKEQARVTSSNAANSAAQTAGNAAAKVQEGEFCANNESV